MNSVLADTSVWIDHLRKKNAELDQLLFDRRLLMHEHVIGELMLGSLRNRSQVMQFFQDLPKIETAFNYEVWELIEKRKLYARGIGFSDAHLVASVFLDGTARLWTRDRRLQEICRELSISHEPN